jgi:hypothetical protein
MADDRPPSTDPQSSPSSTLKTATTTVTPTTPTPPATASADDPFEREAALARLRTLEQEYDRAAQDAADAETRRVRLAEEVERARRQATFTVVGGARGAAVVLPLAGLPASRIRLNGRSLEWTTDGSPRRIDLADIKGLRLSQRARMHHTLLASTLFALALSALILLPVRWPRPSVLVGGFALFFLLAASGAALVLATIRHHLVVRTATITVRVPLANDDLVAEGGRSCNADRFLVAARDAIAGGDSRSGS